MKNRVFVFSVLFLVLLLSACSKPGPAVSAKNDVDYYTCTMHPWVHSKKPGTCPVCGMDLVPVYKSKPQGDQASQIAWPILQSRVHNRNRTTSTFQWSVSNSSESPTLKRNGNDSCAPSARSVW